MVGRKVASPCKSYDILGMCLVCLRMDEAGFKAGVDEGRLNKKGDHKLLKRLKNDTVISTS